MYRVKFFAFLVPYILISGCNSLVSLPFLNLGNQDSTQQEIPCEEISNQRLTPEGECEFVSAEQYDLELQAMCTEQGHTWDGEDYTCTSQDGSSVQIRLDFNP